jgi:hypothetical protein
MMQALQLLLVLVVGIALACYALVQDYNERAPDSRQSSLRFPPKPDHKEHNVLTHR